jgi:4'-phosphopantetheinyl transferase EntD
MPPTPLDEVFAEIDDGLVLASAPIGATSFELHPLEATALGHATAARRAQFAAGRSAARTAAARLGIQLGPIRNRGDGAPVFDDPAVGSISHTRECAVALIGHKRLWVAVGVDLDDSRGFTEDQAKGFTWTREIVRIQEAFNICRGAAVNFAFGAKEAVFKCQAGLPGGVERLTPLQVRLLPNSDGELMPVPWRTTKPVAAALRCIRVRRLVVGGHVLAAALAAAAPRAV